MNVRFFCLFFMFTTLFMGASAWASLPAQASLSGFEDWSTGEMNGLALNADGHLTLTSNSALGPGFSAPSSTRSAQKTGPYFLRPRLQLAYGLLTVRTSPKNSWSLTAL